jgi:aspergillopepsin I
MRKTCLKYGLEVPDQLEAAVKHVEAAVRNVDSAPPGQTTIPVRPVKGDIEFLIAVQVGNHNLSMDLDTGSSDLYVFPPEECIIRLAPSVVRLMETLPETELRG